MKALDGPIAGRELLLHRAPRFLRIVVSPGGVVDALDQLDDVAKPRETIHVYRLASRVVSAHLNFGSIARGTGFYQLADYRYVPEVDGETVRDTAAWRAWCRAQPEAAVDVDEAPAPPATGNPPDEPPLGTPMTGTTIPEEG